MSDPNDPTPPQYPGSAPIPRPPSEHPMRPNLAPPGTPAAPSPYEEARAAHPPEYNPYASPIVNPYSTLPPLPRGVPGAPEPYAHWWRRVVATLLDWLIVLPFYVAALLIHNPSGTGFGDSVSGGQFLTAVIAGVIQLSAFVFNVWNTIFRQGRRGASLGKQLMQIVVVGESDGRPIGALMTFVRGIMHIVDALACFIGYLWPLWDRKRQTFADKIMSTVVLYLPPVL